MIESIVKIENKEGKLVVSSRVIAEQLMKDHQDVKKKIKEVLEIGTEYFPVQNMNRGKTVEDFMVTKDGFILLCMNYQGYNDFKRAYINKFNEMEKQLKEIAQPKLPQTYLEALKELVKVEEEKLMLENKVKNLTHQNKLYTATEIAKELGFKSASEFNKVLEADKIQYKVNGTWVLCARLAEKGYVSIKQMELDSGKVIYDRKFTGIGRDFLIEKYGKKASDVKC